MMCFLFSSSSEWKLNHFPFKHKDGQSTDTGWQNDCPRSVPNIPVSAPGTTPAFRLMPLVVEVSDDTQANMTVRLNRMIIAIGFIHLLPDLC